MKIRNDLISIKIGKKHYDFQNLILDEYLKVFAKFQLDENDIRSIYVDKSLSYLLIKFDTPIENLNNESILKNEDFDVAVIFDCMANQEITETGSVIQYTYGSSGDFFVRNYETNETTSDISEYYGKKITALGFNSTFWPVTMVGEVPVKAVLDTSNYNIYLQENQDFIVTRKDIITTDALFYSKDKSKVPGPIHLAPLNGKAVLKPNILTTEDGVYSRTGEDRSYGMIYSVGLSSYVERIDKEYIIGQDIEITQNGAELTIEGLNNILSEIVRHPSKNIYPSTNLYPTKSNYKYLVIKYKVWQDVASGSYEEPVYTITDTGYYYHQAIPLNKFGDLELKIKYERG